MANLGSAFDATAVEPSADYSPIPEGEYLAAIAKSDIKDTKTGGRYISLEFEIIDGPAKGRRFWENLNLWNSNAQTVEIAQRSLSSICHAAGKLRVSDTEELHAIPMLVRVGFQKDDKSRNQVKGYKPANGGSAPVQQHAAPAAAAGGAKRGPWA